MWPLLPRSCHHQPSLCPPNSASSPLPAPGPWFEPFLLPERPPPDPGAPPSISKASMASSPVCALGYLSAGCSLSSSALTSGWFVPSDPSSQVTTCSGPSQKPRGPSVGLSRCLRGLLVSLPHREVSSPKVGPGPLYHWLPGAWGKAGHTVGASSISERTTGVSDESLGKGAGGMRTQG